MNNETQKVLQTRSQNLARILENEFKGDLEEFCDRVDLKKETVIKFLNPASDRPCKEKAARRIESILKKSPHTLDYQYEDQREIYYITIETNAHYTYEIISALQDIDSIKECSAVLGDFDIILKVEVENFLFLDLLLAKIARLPGIERSQTYSSVKALRWQRDQSENMNLPPKNAQYYSSNGIESYIERKINYHLDKIKELEKGEISILDNDIIPLDSKKILDGARFSIKAIRAPKERLKEFEAYIDLERRLIGDGVKSQRIILLPDGEFISDWDQYRADYGRFKSIGSDVRFLITSKWTPTPLSDTYEQFVIVDNSFVCVRRDEQDRILIKRNKEMVELYNESFSSNWYNSVSLVHVEDLVRRS